jgi:hypothetical protein
MDREGPGDKILDLNSAAAAGVSCRKYQDLGGWIERCGRTVAFDGYPFRAKCPARWTPGRIAQLLCHGDVGLENQSALGGKAKSAARFAVALDSSSCLIAGLADDSREERCYE